jgi:predicted neuraminidase
MGITDDGGKTWFASEPIVGMGNIQPSVVRRKDGTLVAYMRDNGPPPKRIHRSVSKDDGMTWTAAEDTELPNPGASVEAFALRDGRWAIVYNDRERGRDSLAVSLSDDEGETWKWTRHIERRERCSFHYPSVIQGRDGAIHVTYSYFAPDGPQVKSIKHARFDPAWVTAPA